MLSRRLPLLFLIASFPAGLFLERLVFGDSWSASVKGGFVAMLGYGLFLVLQWFDGVRDEVRARRRTTS